MRTRGGREQLLVTGSDDLIGISPGDESLSRKYTVPLKCRPNLL